MPILKDQLKKLREDLDATIKINKAQVERAEKEAYDKATAEYNSKLEELDKKELEAFKEGDTDAYVEVKQERKELKPPAPPAKKGQAEPTPEFKEWSDKNPWYGDDSAMTLYAEAFASKYSKDHPDASYDKVWAAISTEVKKEFPHKFVNPRRNEPGSVESGTTEPGSGGGGKKFADLPKSAKETFKRLERQFKAQGRKYSRETYANDWFAQS